MSIGAIGDVIFTNQMTTCATNVQNAHNNRVELQNMIAQTLVNEKENEIEDIPEAQEDQGVDPDREHQKNEDDQKTRKLKKHQKEQEQETEQTIDFASHKIDIMI